MPAWLIGKNQSTSVSHVLRKLACRQNDDETDVYGEAATSTGAEHPEMPAWLIGKNQSTSVSHVLRKLACVHGS